MSNQKKPIFIDTKLQLYFEENGYVVTPLLDNSGVRELRNLYHQQVNIELTGEFNETTRHLEDERNQVISDTIKSRFNQSGNQILMNHKIMGGTFFIKRSNSQNEFPIHQDWNIVDEENYYSALIWCPLQEVTEENGAMVVIPGSHKYFQNIYRSGSIHPPRFPFSAFKKWKHAFRTINLKAGDALIYQNSLYHGSHPNTTDKNRIIATGSLLTDDAELLYYHWPNPAENLIQVVDASDEFYLKYIDQIASGLLPEGAKIVKTLSRRPYYPTSNNLLRKISTRLDKKKGIFQRLRSLIHAPE